MSVRTFESTAVIIGAGVQTEAVPQALRNRDLLLRAEGSRAFHTFRDHGSKLARARSVRRLEANKHREVLHVRRLELCVEILGQRCNDEIGHFDSCV